MVERTQAETFDEFTGRVVAVKLEESEIEGKKRMQYHIEIKAEDVEIAGKTGLMHEWIGITPKTTSESVPQGSVIDRYIQELEILDKTLKSCKTHRDVFDWLFDKSFLFKKKQLGKSFEGKAAKDYWIPVQIIQSK